MNDNEPKFALSLNTNRRENRLDNFWQHRLTQVVKSERNWFRGHFVAALFDEQRCILLFGFFQPNQILTHSMDAKFHR